MKSLNIHIDIDDSHLLVRVTPQAANVLQVLHRSGAAVGSRLCHARLGQIHLRLTLAAEVRLMCLGRVRALCVEVRQLDSLRLQRFFGSVDEECPG